MKKGFTEPLVHPEGAKSDEVWLFESRSLYLLEASGLRSCGFVHHTLPVSDLFAKYYSVIGSFIFVSSDNEIML